MRDVNEIGFPAAAGLNDTESSMAWHIDCLVVEIRDWPQKTCQVCGRGLILN